MQNYRTNRIPIENPAIESSEKSPEKKAHGLRKNFLDTLDQITRDQSISFSPLDSWVYILAIPASFRYSLDEAKQIAKEIQHTILPPKKPRSLFQIMTWHEIANEHYNMTPSFREWYKGIGQHFDDGCQFIFFIDTETVLQQINQALKPYNFEVSNQDTLGQTFISDGHLEMKLPLMQLVEKCLWMATDLNEVLETWSRTLTPQFKQFQAILRALKAHFKDAHFKVEKRRIFMETQQGSGELNYEKIAHAIEYSKLTPSEWLKPLTVIDVLSFETHVIVGARSQAYTRVWPGSLCEAKEGLVMVCEKELPDRLIALNAASEHDSERFQRFLMEDKRLLPSRQFKAHSFCHDDGELFTMALVGDQVASIVLYPELVRSALLTSYAAPKRVRVVAASEDIVVIAHEKAPWPSIEEAIRRAHALLLRLLPDGSDALFYDKIIDVPMHGCGKFAFNPIPTPYFDLMETAEDASLALPPGRSHYLRGLAFELIREWGLAEAEFRRAFGADSSDGDISHALGRALSELGRYKESLQFLKRAINCVPNDPEIANTYGLALLKSNHTDLAARSFERAVELAPDDPQFLSNLGQSYFMSQRLKDAERVLSKALEYAPNFSDAHSTMSQIRWRQGDLISARKHARKAFAANPGNKGVQDLLWALTVDEQK